MKPKSKSPKNRRKSVPEVSYPKPHMVAPTAPTQTASEEEFIGTEEMNDMLVEIKTGKPPRLTSPAANAFREKLRKACQDIEARGGYVSFQSEIW